MGVIDQVKYHLAAGIDGLPLDSMVSTVDHFSDCPIFLL
ncbi:MAG: hypothetical protein ACJAS5_000034 [Lentimonas sp.]|jgi:hypothetical protein